MLGTNNNARFQSSLLKNVQSLQTSLGLTTISLQQQLSDLNARINVIQNTLDDDTQIVGYRISLASLGLENVNNTADSTKPISIATQAALDQKQSILSTTNTLPVSHVTDLTTTLTNMNNTIDSKANSSALTFPNIKTSSTDSTTLTFTLGQMNTSISSKADASALNSTNTEVSKKVNTTDLIFPNVKETSQAGARTLAAVFTSINDTLLTKANTAQLIYSEIKASSAANAENLSTALSTINNSIANKVNSSALIFSNIKRSDTDTTTLNTALADKANKTDLIFDNITQSNVLGSLTLANKFLLIESDIQAKATNISPVVVTTVFINTNTISVANKNKIHVFTNGYSNGAFVTTCTVTLPDPTLTASGTLTFDEGDFYHILCMANKTPNGQTASPNNFTVTIKAAGPTSPDTTTFNISLLNAKTNNEALTGAILRIITINNVKRWVRVA